MTHNAESVRDLQCPHCPVYWDLGPRRWNGDPWTRKQADGLLRRHFELCHPEYVLQRPTQFDGKVSDEN